MRFFNLIRSSLTVKLSLIMVLLVIIPFGVGTYFLININQTSLQGYILELHNSLAKSMTQSIDEYIESEEEKLEVLSERVFLDSKGATIDYSRISQFVEGEENIKKFVFLDYEGNEILEIVNLDTDIGFDEDFYDRFILECYTKNTYSEFQRAGDESYLLVGTNVLDYGVMIGIIKPFELNMILSGESVGEEGVFTLIDANADALFVPSGRKDITTLLSDEDKDYIKQVVKNKTFSSMEVELSDGERMILAYAPDEKFKGGVLLQQPYEEAYYSSIQMRRSALISVVIGGFLAVGVALIFAHNISKPIRDLADATDRLSRGDFPVVLETSKREDEIGQLMERFNETAEKLFEDELTGKYNRRLFYRRLQENINIAREEEITLSLLITDVDNFKDINDNYGHSVGDDVLRELSNILQSSIRERDTLFRYAGDEFIVILPNTGVEDARSVSERILHEIRRDRFFANDDEEIDVKVSIGVAELDVFRDNFETIFNKADKALYFAKKELGGNTTFSYEDLIKVSDDG